MSMTNLAPNYNCILIILNCNLKFHKFNCKIYNCNLKIYKLNLDIYNFSDLQL
jgi:hypothetical protein